MIKLMTPSELRAAIDNAELALQLAITLGAEKTEARSRRLLLSLKAAEKEIEWTDANND